MGLGLPRAQRLGVNVWRPLHQRWLGRHIIDAMLIQRVMHAMRFLSRHRPPGRQPPKLHPVMVKGKPSIPNFLVFSLFFLCFFFVFSLFFLRFSPFFSVLSPFCLRFVSVLSPFCLRFVSVLSPFCLRFVFVLSLFCLCFVFVLSLFCLCVFFVFSLFFLCFFFVFSLCCLCVFFVFLCFSLFFFVFLFFSLQSELRGEKVFGFRVLIFGDGGRSSLSRPCPKGWRPKAASRLTQATSM